MAEKRLNSIDVFRGLAIAGMVLVNFLAGVDWIPAWLKHAHDIGYTVADLVAPMFIFAIGLTYGLSARRRLEKDGQWGMTQHFIIRFFAILGIGALISAGEVWLQVDGQTSAWGVLQAIGVAGLVTLVFIRTSLFVRLGAGLAILFLYQFLLDRYWLDAVLSSAHNGLPGSLAWAAMLILSTVMADGFHRAKSGLRNLVASSFLVLILGLTFTLVFPISKNRCSASYVMVSLGLSGLIFSALHILVIRLDWKFSWLVMWGKNPLLLYVLHLLLLGIIVLPGVPAWNHNAPAWLTIIQAGFLFVSLSWIAWLLEKKKLYLKI